MGMTNAERQARWRERQQQRIADLEKAKLNGGAPDTGEVAALARELAAAKAEIAALKAELLDTLGARFAPRERNQREPKTEKPPLPPDEERDRIIKGLKTRARNLAAELRASEEHYKDAIAKAGGMSRATEIAVDKVLHPDARRHLSRADLDAALDHACPLWNAWKDDKNRARRKGR